MATVNLEEIKKKYNFKQISVATWRDPKGSILAARGGPTSPSISPEAAGKPFIPSYKVTYKLPEPTDDKASDDEGENGSKPDSENPAAEEVPVDSPLEAPDPEAAEVAAGVRDEGHPDDIVETVEESFDTIDEPTADDEGEAAKEELLLSTSPDPAPPTDGGGDVVEGNEAAQDTAQIQPEVMDDEHVALPETEDATPPPAPSPPPAEPLGPESDADNAPRLALETAAAILTTDEALHDPDVVFVTTLEFTDVLVDVPSSPSGDRTVHFAPGTPEPKPTARKKKSAKGSKQKSKKRMSVPIDSLPDDIVSIVDEALGDVPAPVADAPVDAIAEPEAASAVDEPGGPAEGSVEATHVQASNAAITPEIEHQFEPSIETIDPGLSAASMEPLAAGTGPDDGGDVIKLIVEETAPSPIAADEVQPSKPKKKSSKSSSKDKDKNKSKKKSSKSKVKDMAQSFEGLDILTLPQPPVLDLDDLLRDIPRPPPEVGDAGVETILSATEDNAVVEDVDAGPTEATEAADTHEPGSNTDVWCPSEDADGGADESKVSEEAHGTAEAPPELSVHDPAKEEEMTVAPADSASTLDDVVDESQHGTEAVDAGDELDHDPEGPVPTEGAAMLEGERTSGDGTSGDDDEHDSVNVTMEEPAVEEMFHGEAEGHASQAPASSATEAAAELDAPDGSSEVGTIEPTQETSAETDSSPHAEEDGVDEPPNNPSIDDEPFDKPHAEDETTWNEAAMASVGEHSAEGPNIVETSEEAPTVEETTVEETTVEETTVEESHDREPAAPEPNNDEAAADEAVTVAAKEDLPAESADDPEVENPPADGPTTVPEDVADTLDENADAEAREFQLDPSPEDAAAGLAAEPSTSRSEPEVLKAPTDADGKLQPTDEAPVPDAPSAEPVEEAVEEAVEEVASKDAAEEPKIEPTHDTQEATPEAPPSPTLSKGSSHKHRADHWERKHVAKQASSDTKAEKVNSSKRYSSHSKEESRGTERPHRSRRYSMTAEEEAERRRRREARNAEETARIAREERRRAEEEELRRIRHEARRAARRAAAEEAAKIAREEAEAIARQEAEARRKRHEERGKAKEPARPQRTRRESLTKAPLFFRTSSDQPRGHRREETSTRSSRHSDRPRSERSSSLAEPKVKDGTPAAGPSEPSSSAVAETGPSSSNGSKSHRRHRERPDSDRPRISRKDSERHSRRPAIEERPRSFFASLLRGL